MHLQTNTVTGGICVLYGTQKHAWLGLRFAKLRFPDQIYALGGSSGAPGDFRFCESGNDRDVVSHLPGAICQSTAFTIGSTAPGSLIDAYASDNICAGGDTNDRLDAGKPERSVVVGTCRSIASRRGVFKCRSHVCRPTAWLELFGWPGLIDSRRPRDFAGKIV